MRAAEQLAEVGVNTRHNLSGRMFQNLLVDRMFLATVYTLLTSTAFRTDGGGKCGSSEGLGVDRVRGAIDTPSVCAMIEEGLVERPSSVAVESAGLETDHDGI